MSTNLTPACTSCILGLQNVCFSSSWEVCWSDQWQGDLITVMLNLHRMMQIKPLPGSWETHLCFCVSVLLIWSPLCTHLLLNCCWNFPKTSERWGADKCQWTHAYFNFLERWSMSIFSMWKYFLLSHAEREFCCNL